MSLWPGSGDDMSVCSECGCRVHGPDGYCALCGVCIFIH